MVPFSSVLDGRAMSRGIHARGGRRIRGRTSSNPRKCSSREAFLDGKDKDLNDIATSPMKPTEEGGVNEEKAR